MSTISKTVFEQYATTPENKALEEMQTDVRDLSRKVSSFAKDAAEILSSESIASTGRKANLSLFTKQMFGVVVLLTLALNFGLCFVTATLGQLIIANVGISVLHVLVSMCVVSDLAKGKTYFQNKREQIQERIQTVSVYLKELMQDRQQWVNAVDEIKWLSENEQIKLQMAKLEVSTQQDKLDLTLSLLAERTTAIEVLEQEQSELTRDNARLATRNRELMEDLQTANQDLESKERDKAQREQEIAQLKLLEEDAKSLLDAVTRESQSQESALAEKLLAISEMQDQLQSIHQETEQLKERFAETNKKVTDSEAQQLQLNQSLAQLTQEIEEKEIAVQANCDKSVELLTLYETLEVEKKDLAVSIEAAKLELEALERHLQVARADSQVLEIQMQKMQQENIELINRTVLLESQSTSQVEMLASSEAQLRSFEEKLASGEAQLRDIEEVLGCREAALHSIEEMQRTKEAKVHNAQKELAQVERCVANLLQRMGELECLSVAKCISEQLSFAADVAGSEVQPIATFEVDTSPEPCAACLQRQMDAESRECVEVMLADLNSRQVAKQQLNLAEQELLAIQARIELNEADLVNLQTRMAELDQEYRVKAHSAHDLDHQLADLQFKLDETRSEISASCFELEGLRTTNAELVLQCALLEEKSANTLSEQHDVHHDLTNLQEEMDAARIALHSLTEQRDRQAMELEDLSDAVDTRRSQLTEIELELKELSVRKQALQGLELEIENALQSLETLREEGQVAASEAQDCQMLVVANEKRIHELSQESKTLEEENHLAADRLKSISEEVADAQSVSQQWQSYLTSLQAEMQVCSDRKASLENEVDLLQSQIEAGLLRTQDLDDSLSQRTELETTIREMQADQARLSDEVNALKCESDSWTRLNESSREACERLEKEVASLEMVKSNLQQVEADYDERRSAVERLDTELSDLQSNCHQLQSEIQVLESKHLDLVQLEHACEAKQTLLLNLQSEYEDKLRVRQEIDTEIASMKSTHDDLTRLRIDLNETRSNLSQMMEDRKANETFLLDLGKELEAKRCEMCDIQNSLAGKKLQLEDLDEGITMKSLESDEFVHQLDQSRREIGKLAAFRKSTEVTIGALMQQVDSLQEDVSVCHQDVKYAESSRVEMELMIARIETEIRTLMNDRAQLTSETTLANVLLESKRLELSSIRLQIAKSEQESVAWMQSVHQLEMDFQLASLELEAKRLEIKAAMVEEVSKPDIQAEIPVEIAIEEAPSDLVIETQQTQVPTLAVEEDVWNSLHELAQLGQSVRVDEVQVESESQVEGPVSIRRNSSALQPSSKARPDAWASIFSDNR